MKILITGATGLVGTELVSKLLTLGHQIEVVTRNIDSARRRLPEGVDFIECDLNATALPLNKFAGVEAIINLAGESIDARWTKNTKNKILKSRIMSAHNLLVNCPSTIKTIITASAQGFYGNRDDEELTEESSKGSGFLADVCKAWETEFEKTSQRTIILRLGIVISNRGGFFKKIVPLFEKKLGVVLGSGKQWMSYISLNDLVSIIITALNNERYKGVINAVNNDPVTNEQFTKILNKIIFKEHGLINLPAIPEFIIKLILGERSQLILSSLKVKPKKLNNWDFQFQDSNLESLLRKELGKV